MPDGRAPGPGLTECPVPSADMEDRRLEAGGLGFPAGEGHCGLGLPTGLTAPAQLVRTPSRFLCGRGRRSSQISPVHRQRPCRPPPSAGPQVRLSHGTHSGVVEPSSGVPGCPLSTLTVLGRGVGMGRGAGTPRSPARPPEVAPCRWHRAERAERDFTARGPLLSCLPKINLRWIKRCLVSGRPGLSDLSGGESAEEMDLISSGEMLQMKSHVH